MKRVAAAALAVVVAGCASAAPPRAEARWTTATLSRAYERWIFRHYEGPKGYWVCPVGDPYLPLYRGARTCWAEFFGPVGWHSLNTLARLRGTHVRFIAQPRDSLTWTRRWRTVSIHLLHGTGATGTATINAPLRLHDWPWLAGFAGVAWEGKSKRRTFVDSDGPLPYEFEIFERFTCVRGRDVVTCTNVFGDALRYRSA